MGKKNWKRTFLAGLLILTLTACGAKETTQQPPEPTVSQKTEATKSPEATLTPEPTKSPEVTLASEVTLAPEPTKAADIIQTDEAASIKDVFAEQGWKAGTCLSDQMIRNQSCVELIKANFNSITFENHMKPDYIFNKNESRKSGDLVVEFSSTVDLMLDWCRENDMAVRGHTLVWYSQTPNWIFYEDFDTKKPLVSRDVMLARMESFIRQVFEQLEEMGYLELFYAYDVVNEAWMEDGTMRDCLWLQTIGEDYLWYAFYYADKYAPEYIDLYYNDYNEQYKTDALYNFVQTLVDENGNYLIDGIGLQAHLYTDDSIDKYLKTVEKLGSTGLKVNLTELDVCLGSWMEIKPATEANLKEQGRYYYELIGGLMKLAREGMVEMDALTFWGFADNLSWRKERSPLMFDSSYKPKYAYFGALQQLEKAGFD